MKGEKQKVIRYMIHNVLFSLKVNYISSKKYFFLKCFIAIYSSTVPLLHLFIWKNILNQISGIDTSIHAIMPILIIYSLIYLATKIIDQFGIYVNQMCNEFVHLYIEKVMIEKVSRMDLAFFDSSEMEDKVRRVRSNFDLMKDATWQVLDLFSQAVTILFSFFVLCKYHPYLGILNCLVLIPHLFYEKKHTEKSLELEYNQIKDQRKREYYREAFFDQSLQMEMKLNRFKDYFLKKQNFYWEKVHKENKKFKTLHSIYISFVEAFQLSGTAATIFQCIFDIKAGNILLGDVSYQIGIAEKLNQSGVNLMFGINRFLGFSTRLVELMEFMNMDPLIEKSGVEVPSKSPEIEFENVFFSYPNANNNTLKNCSFHINPNEKVGLIGYNGAGKSTIIKLLFRFYDVKKGNIWIDKKDIKMYDVYELRKIFGVLFQDYVTYCLPFREIVALSDFVYVNDDLRIKKACDFSGISSCITEWENGYNSVLGRYFEDNGKDMSGGQWQLTGLARAYFRERDYMILDEPSAAIDPISEDRIFKQLYDLSKEKSSIIISHRLSNTMLADKILVLKDGCVIEEGSHEELIKKNGIYTELFMLQAEKYV